VAIALSAAIVVLMAALLPIEDVAAAADIMFLLLFVQVNVAVVRLRKLRPDLDRGFHIPWVPLVPILAIATMAFLAVFLSVHYPLGWIAVLAWLAVGGLVYYGYSHRREIAFEEHARWMERIERREYRVLAAVSSPATMPSLVDAAIALAKEHGGEVVVLTVVEVPEGVTLLTGRGLARALEPLLEAATQRVSAQAIPVRSVVKIAHRVSEGILQTAREEACNFLVLGRPASASLLERLVASITERVLQAAPCQVGIVYGRLEPARVRGVVVPVTSGPNPRLAATLGPALARDLGVQARALTVVPSDVSEDEAEALVSAARRTLEDSGWSEAPQVVRGLDAVGALASMIRPGELVIIGAPSTDSVAALVGETVPNALAALGYTPLLVVRDVPPRPAWGFQRFFLRER